MCKIGDMELFDGTTEVTIEELGEFAPEQFKAGAVDALHHVENYCNDHIIKFAVSDEAIVRRAVKMLQAVNELIGGIRACYEKPERYKSIIRKAQRKRNKERKEYLKLAA